MEVMFQDLITSIGVSVQEARRVIEDAAMELYFQGYEKDSADQPVYGKWCDGIRCGAGSEK